MNKNKMIDKIHGNLDHTLGYVEFLLSNKGDDKILSEKNIKEIAQGLKETAEAIENNKPEDIYTV